MVVALVEKKAVRIVADGSWGYLSSMFFIPKKSGGFRLIINLKPLNHFVNYNHVKMENMDVGHRIFRKGDWMVKLY